MKKLLIPFLSILLITVFSCKKESSIVPNEKIAGADSLANLSSFAATTVVKDTIPPTNAVSVKTLGVYGDGVHDDTKALQSAINSQTVIYFPKGTYIINQTLNLRSGVKIYGTNGATIKAGASMSGSLLTLGRYFYLYSVKGASIVNLIFQPSTVSFRFGSWANAIIYLANSSQNDVKYNTFNFKQAYNPTGAEGVWLTGSTTMYNYIGYNKMNTVGLEYAEDGASYNIIIRNTITNAHSDGMSAHGNSSNFCKGNSVFNNTVINAGHMGIEDWGNVDASNIRGNTIAGSGKSTLEQNDGIGLSLVGVNTVAAFNTLSDAQLMYIEVGGNNNCRVDSNTINDTQSAITGIIVNFGLAKPLGSKSYSSLVRHNLINNCNEGISVEGSVNPVATITDNNIYNSRYIGINVSSSSPTFNVLLTKNNVVFNKPSVTTRRAISVYSDSPTANQKTTVTSNTITYATTAANGKGLEVGFSIGNNNINYTGNKVTANKISSGGYPVFSISSNGYTFSGITVNANTFTGGFVDLTNLKSLVNTNNSISN